ncbi:hypothetical protein DL770_011511 [Monosporascus sp. CRB-9-2]|nr:hypothetical protein DL770_011511 [Monosporascus sp. CRB-9-2]
MPHADDIGIDQFEGAVAVLRHKTLSQRERVVVGRRVAQIEPHECDRRRAVRQHLHVARRITSGVPTGGRCVSLMRKGASTELSDNAERCGSSVGGA